MLPIHHRGHHGGWFSAGYLARQASGCGHEEVITTLRPLADAKGITLEATMPPQEFVLSTDRRALSQILLNLTNNAIKFTEQGSVRLSLSQRPQHGQRVTEISVVDTGIGIDSDEQTKLFQRFTQADAARLTRQEGSGLGLHLSQKLAGLLGGQIDDVLQ